MRNGLKSAMLGYAAAIAVFCSAATVAQAQLIFVPPNDTVGHVFSSNLNDGWSGSRGVVFQATTTQTITGVGLYQDLTGMLVNFEIDRTTSASGNIGAGKTILRSGSNTFTTSGLQFITFPIAPLQLTAGNFYQVRFDFSGNSNQNFFYDNQDVRFSQGGFTLIDGTAGDDTGNTVMPRIELLGISVATASVPAMSNAMLAALALLLAAGSYVALRRRS